MNGFQKTQRPKYLDTIEVDKLTEVVNAHRFKCVQGKWHERGTRLKIGDGKDCQIPRNQVRKLLESRALLTVERAQQEGVIEADEEVVEEKPAPKKGK